MSLLSLIFALTLVLPTGTQRPVTGSCFSTKYSLSGRPPSSSGFSHLSLQPFLVTLDTFKGPLGFPGPAVVQKGSERSEKMPYTESTKGYMRDRCH